MAVQAWRQTGEQVSVLSRVRTALGKVVQTELTNLKRLKSFKATTPSGKEIVVIRA